eukprot:1452383-Pleurochrysis_carterae.AAC.3
MLAAGAALVHTTHQKADGGDLQESAIDDHTVQQATRAVSASYILLEAVAVLPQPMYSTHSR